MVQSFNDTLINEHTKGDATEVEDWEISKKVSIGFVDKGKTIPKITFTQESLSLLSIPWRKAIAAKLLGKSIGYQLF